MNGVNHPQPLYVPKGYAEMEKNFGDFYACMMKLRAQKICQVCYARLPFLFDGDKRPKFCSSTCRIIWINKIG